MNPHKITFISDHECDVCKNPSSKSHKINIDFRFIGWDICEKQSCKDTLLEWVGEYIIPINDLISRFGDKIKIIRTNGTVENDWVLSSDAYREKENTDYWVHVKSNNLSKMVNYNDLIKWNK